MKKRSIAVLFAGVMALGLCACGGNTQNTPSETESVEEDSAVMELSSAVVDAFEWGPAVDKIVVKPQGEVSSTEVADYGISTTGSVREITEIYKSDASGEKADDGEYLTFEMKVQNYVGTPFKLDTSQLAMGMNQWVKSFDVTLSVAEGKTLTIGDEEYSGVLDEEDMISDLFIPGTEVFVKDAYEGDEITLQRGAYEPDALKEDKVKNPLVIWLHGGSEGGEDIDIALLGNEVTALTREDIQSYFTSENGSDGAYVLAVQCPTYWMQSEEGAAVDGTKDSMYREVLTEAIEDYVKNHEDVDTSRIYVGGCSNGGYMTMNLMAHDTKNFFAAAYPVCEAYGNNLMSDEDIKQLAGRNIWFVQSINDKTVDPYTFGMVTYQRLLQAGAKNCWYSMFESVLGVDKEDASYNGHWSWIRLFNNQVTGAQNPEKIAASSDTESYGFEPSDEGGGSEAPQGYTNFFEWLNAQTNQ
ncbi:MAG: prolyl oligopeptidase family serine peptidase [Lachnospiraceae bacterium]|nr:prolyl oligopeptidase family serine peptidase [Lachnospiraceae bacterium]